MKMFAERLLVVVLLTVLCAQLLTVGLFTHSAKALSYDPTMGAAFWKSSSEFTIIGPTSPGFPTIITGLFDADPSANYGTQKIVPYSGVVIPQVANTKYGDRTYDFSGCQGKPVNVLIDLSNPGLNMANTSVSASQIFNQSVSQGGCKNNSSANVVDYLRNGPILTDFGIFQYGESYSWKDSDTVMASGGLFGQTPVPLSISHPNTQVIRNCAVNITIDNISAYNTQATLGINNDSINPGSGGKSTPACSNDVINSQLPGHAITIANPDNRGKSVIGNIDVTYQSDSADKADKVPANLGVVLNGPGTPQNATMSCTPQADGSKWYANCKATFQDQPAGDYYACLADNTLCSDPPATKQDKQSITIHFAKGVNSIDPSQKAPHVDCSWSINPLTWVMCPLLDLSQSIINSVGGFIKDQLNINANLYFDKTSDSGQHIYAAWNSVRLIAMGLLVVIALVMVIAQALSIDLIDTYTVKKVLPRIVIAVIAISLSWELTRLAVIFFNDLARAVQSIIIAPFGNIPNPSLSGGKITILAGGLAATATALGTLGMLSFLMTAAVALLIAFVAIVLRQMLVILLVILAPIAIIAFILPNTQKAWKLWHESFFGALLVYTIITAFISIGAVFGKIAGATNTGGTIDTAAAPFIALIATYIPYFLIPKAFSMASGVIGNLTGMVNDRSRGAFDRIRKYRQDNGARHRERLGRRVVGTRADWQNRLQNASSSANRNALSRLALRQASRAVGGYNIQHADALRRAAVGKELNDQIATGRDDEIRGLTVDKRTAEYRVKDGRREFRTLGGAWVSEAAVDEGHRRWGKDTYAQQTALSYEMRKASTEEELQHIANNYHNTARAWGMSENDAAGAWIGAAFENQNQHLEYKYSSWKNGRMSEEKGKDFVKEIYEKRGSYPLAQMGSNTFEQLKNVYTDAEQRGDADTMNKISAIAETYMLRGGMSIPGQIEGDKQIPGVPARGEGGQAFQTNAQGAAHVAERVRELAVLTGVYQQPGSSRVSNVSQGPPPDIPLQH